MKKASNSFGSVIRTIRLRKKLTMKEVAARMQIRETTIRKYEMNELTPKTSTRLALAEALEVNPAILLADWSPSPSSAVGHLLSYFESFGGSFIEKDGHIAIEFEALEPFIRTWADEYICRKEEYAAFSSKAKQAATVDSYFDFLVSTGNSIPSPSAVSACCDSPSMQDAVHLTLKNPPRLRSKNSRPDSK